MNYESNIYRLEKIPVFEYKNDIINQPTVSVCVTTYQHVNFIEECLESILMQKTDFDFEILLGDDSSNDGTREICINYAKKYPKSIRLFLHHTENNIFVNGSQSGRFNFIYNLLKARGKYIALCDGDDYWTDPFKLQKQVDFLVNHPEIVISFHNSIIYKEDLKIFTRTELKDTNQLKIVDKKELALGFNIPLRSIMYRNEVIPLDLFGKLKYLNGDTILIYLLSKFGSAAFQKEIANSVYRLNSNSIWYGLKTLEKVHRKILAYEELKSLNGYDSDMNIKIRKTAMSLFRAAIKRLNFKYILISFKYLF